jgi:spore coat polysaccharide biosynthesis protein SpsF
MTAIIVFSRMDSERLPGKAMADLCGRPLLGRVLDRVRRAQLRGSVVVATSERASDDEIASFSKSEGVAVFRGHDVDVVERALRCCDAFGFDAFVRISGDSPFVPPDLIDHGIATAKESGADLVTNVFPRSFPAGASVEVVKAEALCRAQHTMTADEREHVTKAFYDEPRTWRIVNFAADTACPEIRLTVDTGAELEVARSITAQLMPKPELAALADVIALRRAMLATA